MVSKNDYDIPYILGVDLGSASSKLALATFDPELASAVEIVKVVEFSSQKSVERGSVVNVESLSQLLRTALSTLLSDIPSNTRLFYVFSLNAKGMRSFVNKATYPFSTYKEKITQTHIDFANKMAGNLSLDEDQLYLHFMQQYFRVDDRSPCKNPIGELGTKLESEVLLISVLKNELIKIRDCAHLSGIRCDLPCAGPLASAESLLTQSEREKGVLVVDFGDQKTCASLYQDGLPRATAIVPLGSHEISSDLALELQVPFSIARSIKHQFCCVHRSCLEDLSPELDLSDLAPEYHSTVSSQRIYEIAYARTIEIFSLLLKRLVHVDSAVYYPLVITGEGAKLMGLTQVLEEICKTRVRLAQPWNWGGDADQYRSPRFSQVIGLTSIGAQYYQTFLSKEKHPHGETHSVLRSPKEMQKKRQDGSQQSDTQMRSGINWFGAFRDKVKTLLSLGDLQD